MYKTHIRSVFSLLSPIAQSNDETDHLLVGNVVEASEFHKKNHDNIKDLKKKIFFTTWQQAKKIIKKGPTYPLYNQTALIPGSNPKGNKVMEFGRWMCLILHSLKN